MRKRISEFLRRNLNPFIWLLFFLLYMEARIFFHTFELVQIPFYYKAIYHIGFFIPLGMFLWRREFSIRNVVTILLLLALVPEGYQYYLNVTVPLDIHLLDYSLNLAGGVVGICLGMLWTFTELVTK